jgi:hypothetical protein
MIQKFPFKDQVLQAIGYLNPNTKDKVSAEDGKYLYMLRKNMMWGRCK